MPTIIYLAVCATGLLFAFQVIFWSHPQAHGVGGIWFVCLVSMLVLQVAGKSTRVWSWWLLPIAGVASHMVLLPEFHARSLLIETLYLVALAAVMGWVAKEGT